MSIKDLIEKNREKNKGLTPMTVRVSEQHRSFIDALCEDCGTSRQEILLKFVSEGIANAMDELDPAKGMTTSTTDRFHVLNTNRAYSSDDQEMMVSRRVAAAFGDRKDNISRIKAGDWVFLYENAVGIVAFGQGSGETLTENYRGKKDRCCYQALQNFTVLDKPVNAKEIKKTLCRDHIFLQTMASMPDGQKLLERLQRD